MRIYSVKTPNGERLVEAGTKTQAINHCVSTDYSAEPISSSELYAKIQSGVKVEKVEPAKKSATAEQSQPPLPQASSQAPAAGATTQPTGSNPPAGSMPQQSSVTPPASTANHSHTGAAAPTTHAAPLPHAAAPIASGAPAASGQWNPPAAAGGNYSTNPVIAEQQKVNPDAAAAAGAPAPIIPVNRPAAQTPPPAPSNKQ